MKNFLKKILRFEHKTEAVVLIFIAISFIYHFVKLGIFVVKKLSE